MSKSETSQVEVLLLQYDTLAVRAEDRPAADSGVRNQTEGTILEA